MKTQVELLRELADRLEMIETINKLSLSNSDEVKELIKTSGNDDDCYVEILTIGLYPDGDFAITCQGIDHTVVIRIDFVFETVARISAGFDIHRIK